MSKRGPTCAVFLEHTIAYFTAYGITGIERLSTDNAWSYRDHCFEVCAAHGIRRKFLKPYCPWQNGRVERFNRTPQIGWAYRLVFLTNAEPTAALAPWLEHYNNERRHSAPAGKPRPPNWHQRDD